MLNAIIQFSLRFRGVVIALACILVGYGLYRLGHAKYDVFPEFAPPQVVIQTEAHGLSPEQVEALVTQPIENAINGAPGIETLRSSSIQGLSVITATFEPRNDIYRARQLLAEQLATLATQLPEGVQAPVLTPLTTSTSFLLVIGLTSERRSLMELRTVADWTVKQRLLAVPGVAKVAVFGGNVRQLQIRLRPERLVRYHLAIEDVLAAARRATGVRGAGFIDTENQRIILQTEGQSLTTAELAKAVVALPSDAGMGLNVTLGDVAQVVEGPEPPVGAASIMGRPGIQLVVSAQFGSNTMNVTQKVEKALEELRPTLKAQDVVLSSDLFRPANFIETAIGNVRFSLIIGGILVATVLFLFLMNFRVAAISCAAIPLSLLTATTLLGYFGFNLDTMTLGGLAIAIGEVVDDAVIDVENILRRMRENSSKPQPLPIFRVILDASIEVRSAVVYATFAVALVFLPVLTLSGLAGRLFSPLATAYVMATLASLAVALTVTPALCCALLGGKGNPLLAEEPRLTRWLKRQYRSLLLRVEKHPRGVIGGVAMFTAAGLALLPFFGGGFLPELREGHFIVHMSAIPGTSLQESLRVGHQVTLELLKLPFVRSVSQRAGRAEKADDVWGPHYSEFNVDLKPLGGEEAESAMSEIRNALLQFPGVNFAVKTFLTERVEETLSGYTASVVVNIYGNDLDSLDAKAREVARALNQVGSAMDVQLQSPPGTPQIAIQLRKEAVAGWGFDPVDVLDSIRVAFQGRPTGQVYEGNRVFDVSVILDPEERKNIMDIGALPLRSPTGSYVRLRELADIRMKSGRYVVLHQGARRVQTVTCNVAGGDVNTFVANAKKQVASSVSFPTGTYVEFTGAAEAQSQARRDLLAHSLVAGAGIVILLSMVMGNIRNLVLILTNLPFALVGGVLAVFFSGAWLSIGSLVGFVTLFGITLRNSIMMISHYEHLVSSEGMIWGMDAAIRGATDRLLPILMTALVTGLGLLPLAIGSGQPGREIEGPMAIVILGGLVTSTALNLLVLPTLALRFGRFERSAAAAGVRPG